jgi:hypothetical protein
LNFFLPARLVVGLVCHILVVLVQNFENRRAEKKAAAEGARAAPQA